MISAKGELVRSIATLLTIVCTVAGAANYSSMMMSSQDFIAIWTWP
jgi:hypothetical protein